MEVVLNHSKQDARPVATFFALNNSGENCHMRDRNKKEKQNSGKAQTDSLKEISYI